MHAVYMRSMRSPSPPLGGRNRLQYDYPNMDVFSQAPEPDNTEYLQDSFCVDGEDEEEDG